jgi:sec-independent protein translocase protein TatA
MNAFIIAGVVGPWQIVIVVALALLFFGGKKIPELMKGLGEGMKEFKKATKDVTNDTPQDQDKLKS